MTWFLIDISFYTQQLLQNHIYTAVNLAGNMVSAPAMMSALEETFKNARAQAIMGAGFLLTGYWFTVLLIDRTGRKKIQLMGFFIISIFMFILGADFRKLSGHAVPGDNSGYIGNIYLGGNHLAFIILYGLALFFSKFGPNTTTFVIPAELFPARLRSTCNGIASASGKAGAIVGTFSFLYLTQGRGQEYNTIQNPFYSHKSSYGNSFNILGCCALLGFFISVWLPETNGISLEGLSGENEDQNSQIGGEELSEVKDDKQPFERGHVEHIAAVEARN